MPDTTEKEKPVENLTEVERLSLEITKLHIKLAQANAEATLARTEFATLNHRYLVLQLYHKYGLTEADGINEQGQILRDYVKEIPDGHK